MTCSITTSRLRRLWGRFGRSSRTIKRKLPGVSIVVQGVLPVGRDAGTPIRRSIARLNQLLEAEAGAWGATYLDVGQRLLAADGTLPAAVSGDGLHLTAQGYQVWAASLRPVLRKLIGAWDADTTADFDGDGKADLSLYRPSDGRWSFVGASGTGVPTTTYWGGPGDRPVTGDFDGDGVTDVGLFSTTRGRWSLRTATGVPIATEVAWGLPGDLPVPADYDGDGRTDVAVYRPSDGRWYVSKSGGGAIYGVGWGLQYGLAGAGGLHG